MRQNPTANKSNATSILAYEHTLKKYLSSRGPLPFEALLPGEQTDEHPGKFVAACRLLNGLV